MIIKYEVSIRHLWLLLLLNMPMILLRSERRWIPRICIRFRKVE